MLVAFIAWRPVRASAQNSFTQFDDVQPVLALLTEALPAQLRSSDISAQRKAWPDWVAEHDREIRRRLLRGDEDTAEPRVDAVAEREVDDPVRAAEVDGRLRTLLGEGVEAFARAASQEDYQDVIEFHEAPERGSGWCNHIRRGWRDNSTRAAASAQRKWGIPQHFDQFA